jgi:hypothetical protein
MLVAEHRLIIKRLGRIGRQAIVSKAKLKIPNKVNATLRASVENKCGVKMPDNLVGYTKHGIDRALLRDDVGVSAESILDTWKTPTKVKFEMDEYGGNFKMYGKTSIVVVNSQGEIVSCWAKGKEGHRQ